MPLTPAQLDRAKGAVVASAALPTAWTAGLHGWPGYGASDLERLAAQAVQTAPLGNRT